MTSRISGIGLSGIKNKIFEMHREAFGNDPVLLPVGGFFRSRAGSELHAFEGQQIHTLQSAVGKESFSIFRKYSEAVAAMPPIHLRDLLDFKSVEQAIPVDDVESITEIRKRFVTGAMSHGRPVGGGPRDPGHRHESHRCPVGLRRGRRGGGALPAAGQRRQRQFGHQADRFRDASG